MMRDRRHRNKSHQSATNCIERQLRADSARGFSFHSDVLQNASKCSALRLGSSTIHLATATTVATTQRSHGDTQGRLECPPRLVSAIQRTTITSPIPFKPLQTPAKRCNLLQSAVQEIAIFCNRMLRNASFCFAHTCAPPRCGLVLTARRMASAERGRCIEGSNPTVSAWACRRVACLALGSAPSNANFDSRAFATHMPY
jgi:hypothetical protein